jgi:hypothetical protein
VQVPMEEPESHSSGISLGVGLLDYMADLRLVF